MVRRISISIMCGLSLSVSCSTKSDDETVQLDTMPPTSESVIDSIINSDLQLLDSVNAGLFDSQYIFPCPRVESAIGRMEDITNIPSLSGSYFGRFAADQQDLRKWRAFLEVHTSCLSISPLDSTIQHDTACTKR
jgi:hypothetical protein